MIIRIVKLTINPIMVSQFLEEVEEMKTVVRNQNGCISLEILNSIEEKNVYFTISKWHSEENLDTYRASEKFYNFWKKIKNTFLEKAVADTFFE